jgi:hypothetical protein
VPVGRLGPLFHGTAPDEGYPVPPNKGPRIRGICGTCGKDNVSIKLNGRLGLHRVKGEVCAGVNGNPAPQPPAAALDIASRARTSLDLHIGAVQRNRHLLTDPDRARLVALALSAHERTWFLHLMAQRGPGATPSDRGPGPGEFQRLYRIIRGE